MAAISIKKFKAEIETGDSSMLSFIRMPFDVKETLEKAESL